MNSIIPVIIFSIFVHGFCFSQSCLPNGITFLSQNQIDEFSTNYPGCVEIEGHVSITSYAEDLQGLSEITSIHGALNIYSADSLITLEGLENLTSIGEWFYLSENYNLIDISSLENLSSIGGYLQIGNNNQLPSLNGLGGLTEIPQDLILSNDSMTDLEGLNNLETIGGDFRIVYNDGLESLNGVETLTSIEGDLVLTSNNALSSLSGLENLIDIGGSIQINHCANLPNLEGLTSIEHINGSLVLGNSKFNNFSGLNNLKTIGANLEISYNNVLPSLFGLENLEVVGEIIEIKGNNDLTNIDALQNLDYSQVGELRIINNDLLSVCANNFVCNYLNLNGPNDIYSNNLGCSNEAEVIESCESLIGKIYPFIFFDYNENGLYDQNETSFTQANVTISPGDYTVYSNQNNSGLAYLPFGIYTVSFNESSIPNWELTSGINEYTVGLDLSNPSDTIFFGVYPTEDLSEMKSTTTSFITRCNETTLFNVIAENLGTTITSGTLWLKIDENILNAEYVDSPDTISVLYQYGWNFENLYPGEKLKKQIKLQIPGVVTTPIGSYLKFNSYIDFNTQNNEQFTSFNSTYCAEVQCSYDPNDKLINPVYPNNYALIGEDLIYTIRFQNTGNATAYDVIIRDTLDENLDPSTFRVIASSHEEVLGTTMEEGRYLTFSFYDIYLPDSTTNFEGSQGYVTFRIKANDNIPEETIINNTAAIYFDLNPPVITNTTENVVVSTFDYDEDGFDIFEDCNDLDAEINPDAEEIPNNGIDENCDGLDTPVSTINVSTLPIEIFPNPTKNKVTILLPKNLVQAKLKMKDLNGKAILEKKLDQQVELDLSNLASGIYFLMIQTDGFIWTEKIVKM